MSFQNQGFWMAKGTGTMNDGEVNYDNSSRSELKRSNQWFIDAPEAELFPNKKQAVGIPADNLFTGFLNSNVSQWSNASSFHSMSGHLAEQLFDSKTSRTVNFDERNMPSVESEKAIFERKVNDSGFENDSSFGLSMSCTLEDPRAEIDFGGIRKVKVSQVKESESAMRISMENAYSGMDNSTIATTHAYKTDENMVSMGRAYNKGDGNIMAVGESYERKNNIFISKGRPYNKGDDNISMSQTYRGNNHIAMGHTFSQGDSSAVTMGQTYNRGEENAISMEHIYGKGHGGTTSMAEAFNKVDNSNMSVLQSYNKGESTIISFGGYDVDDTNPSGRLISSYDLMMAQSSLQTSEVIKEKELVKLNADANVCMGHVAASGTDNVSRKKEDGKVTKKLPANNFPSNVRSLLSTGMLDGVPVKYIAWSREKELRGVIKASGYLCGCQTCNFSKVINAYEFERHANCKTKHPNNHIYFESGKTIYGIVQELRSTPQNMLFDVIQTITGSPINQKSFRIWKESFLAATRELQRIYGKDEGKPL